MKKKIDDFIANVIIERHLGVERARNREVYMLDRKRYLMSRDVEEILQLLTKEQVKFLENIVMLDTKWKDIIIFICIKWK